MIAMTEVALEQFGKIDVLVNDAGIIGVSQWWERE
ncbi:MAG TPA: short-chain dehydrogenase, partial [Dehalococcoidia bacterium]|nr:short-chain dehydrogenase [Dehalococcoidia bacterium]